MRKISLSKSLFIEGLRCARLLWLRINKPQLAAPLDAQTEYLFKTGHRVGELARQLFPGGTLIGEGQHGAFARFLAETEAAMASDCPYLFEGAFANETMLCRSDILHRWDDQKWNLAEVKMSGELKSEHPQDVAFQCRCIEDSSHRVDRKYLIHVNKSYIRVGAIEPEKLFVAEEITREVNAEMSGIPAKVEQLIAVARRAEPPDEIVGSRCLAPGRCPFFDYCHSTIPEGSVHELPYGNKLIPLLLERGISKLEDIPTGFPLSQRQAAQVESARTRQPVINLVAIKAFLQQLRYPIHYLDFETVNPCLPVFDHSSPYQKIAFQFSVHTQETAGGELWHHEYLPDNANDPREQICNTLIDILGDHGSILSWNASFEKSILSGLGEKFPKVAGRIDAIISRVVDLIIPFRSGSYSDFRFNGSASLKKVLPVLVPSLTYSGMTIGKGDEASLCFQKFIDGNMTAEEWAALRQDLLAYCKLDTQAMASILDVLYKLD